MHMFATKFEVHLGMHEADANNHLENGIGSFEIEHMMFFV